MLLRVSSGFEIEGAEFRGCTFLPIIPSSAHFFNLVVIVLPFRSSIKISSGSKGHSFCKQCLHNLQFMKTRSSSPNLSKLARADISCQFMKTRSLCTTVQNEWTLITNFGFFSNLLLLLRLRSFK